MTGLYLGRIFRIAVANAIAGIALYGRLSYLQKRKLPVPALLLTALSVVKWAGTATFMLLLFLGFWPFGRSNINDFFHQVNRVLQIF
jgi:hypothetical protein